MSTEQKSNEQPQPAQQVQLVLTLDLQTAHLRISGNIPSDQVALDMIRRAEFEYQKKMERDAAASSPLVGVRLPVPFIPRGRG